MSDHEHRVYAELPAGEGAREPWEEWELADFTQDEEAAIRLVTMPKGRSPWVRVRCHGHDVERERRRTRLRLEVVGSAVRLVNDTRGDIVLRGIGVTAGDGDRVDFAMWRLACPVCGRSADRNGETLTVAVLGALLSHLRIRQQGRDHVARVNWWESP